MKLKEFQEIPNEVEVPGAVRGIPVVKQIYGLQFNPKTKQSEGEAHLSFGHRTPSLIDLAFKKAGVLVTV